MQLSVTAIKKGRCLQMLCASPQQYAVWHNATRYSVLRGVSQPSVAEPDAQELRAQWDPSWDNATQSGCARSARVTTDEQLSRAQTGRLHLSSQIKHSYRSVCHAAGRPQSRSAVCSVCQTQTSANITTKHSFVHLKKATRPFHASTFSHRTTATTTAWFPNFPLCQNTDSYQLFSPWLLLSYIIFILHSHTIISNQIAFFLKLHVKVTLFDF